MPNAANVSAPIILVGPGRSGTTLMSSLFAHHPDCVAIGETANVIFGVWNALRFSAASVTPLVEDGRTVAEDERAGRLVRQAFLTAFPDDRPYWMHKPIGVPRVVVDKYADDPGCDDAGALFWRVMRSSFPEARYITILRHPCDAVLSGVAHWGKDERILWRTISDLARVMMHADAPPIHAVIYDELVREPEPTVRALCEATGLPFHAGMLDAFAQTHVAAPGRERPEVTDFSRRHEWAALDPAWVTVGQRAAITRLFARYGQALEWPPTLDESRLQPDRPLSDAERVERLEALVKAMQASFERRRVDYAEQWRAREEEIARLWNEQQAWIADLERARAWLTQQSENWRAEAERLQRTQTS